MFKVIYLYEDLYTPKIIRVDIGWLLILSKEILLTNDMYHLFYDYN